MKESSKRCARFVIGCDGARSAVRKAIGRPLDGDSAKQAWGVMDVLCRTVFPDVRLKSTIHSSKEGSILIIPREGGYLVRLYIELEKLNENERVSSLSIEVEHLIAAAQRILRPYTFEVSEVAWWSVYEIGQRLCDKFDNVPPEKTGSCIPRIFIAGDACHTHSPKAGQGMNVSMQDAFNLGWKLASVISGRSLPGLLHTYSDERWGVARDLIEFDREFAKLFSTAPRDEADPESKGPTHADFQNYFNQHGRFTAGVATHYEPSLLTRPPVSPDLAKGFTAGMRLHSAPVIRLADAKPMPPGHCMAADARWRLFIFADDSDPHNPSSKLHALCHFLGDAATSPTRRYTPPSTDIDSAIDVRAILQQPHQTINLVGMPPLLLPRKGRAHRLRKDIYRRSSPEPGYFRHARDRPGKGLHRYGAAGAVYILITQLDDFSGFAQFFGQFMIAKSQSEIPEQTTW